MENIKKNKVRTSITIDPELLAEVRRDADKSVSAYIEAALLAYRLNTGRKDADITPNNQ